MIASPSILFALLAALPQEPSTAPQEGWRELNITLQVVNERMLSSLSLRREIARMTRTRPPSNQAEYNAIGQQIRMEIVKDALQVQAGEDLGTDPVQLDRQVKEMMRRMQERYQGTAGMSAFLQEKDRTLYEQQELTRDMLHKTLWDNYVTGEGAQGEGARPMRDSYVRPGYLRFRYRECLEYPEMLPVIGGSGPTVVLQNLYIDPDSAGGEEPSHELALELRRRIADGEDMGDLVESYDPSSSNKQSRGMTEPFVESRLREIDPALWTFLSAANPGDVSEVLSFKPKDKEYWRIVRLVERRPAVIPPLDSFEAQTKLTERIREDVAGWRRTEGLRKLVKASYIWPQSQIPR